METTQSRQHHKKELMNTRRNIPNNSNVIVSHAFR
jgi:hypothetical protein